MKPLQPVLSASLLALSLALTAGAAGADDRVPAPDAGIDADAGSPVPSDRQRWSRVKNNSTIEVRVPGAGAGAACDDSADAACDVKSPRDAASGLPTGKRQHKPVHPASPGVETGDLDGDGATQDLLLPAVQKRVRDAGDRADNAHRGTGPGGGPNVKRGAEDERRANYEHDPIPDASATDSWSLGATNPSQSGASPSGGGAGRASASHVKVFDGSTGQEKQSAPNTATYDLKANKK